MGEKMVPNPVEIEQSWHKKKLPSFHFPFAIEKCNKSNVHEIAGDIRRGSMRAHNHQCHG